MFLHFSWIAFDVRKTHTTRVASFSYDVPRVWILMPCDFTIWTPSWTGTFGLKTMLPLARVTVMSVSPRARIPSHRDFQISSRVNCFARSTRKGKVYRSSLKGFCLQMLQRFSFLHLILRSRFYCMKLLHQ